jgi:23S rRNA (adenine-C8)-methyltransferase
MDEIESILRSTSQPNYRIQQIKKALYSNGVKSYSEITNVPQNLRDLLSEKLDPILSLNKLSEIKGIQVQKILFETKDNQRIESVLMDYHENTERKHHLHSLCISTQSGCALGCKFCATGAVGFKKNLEADEITDQVLYFIQNKYQVTNIIFMGMGEPFSNEENTFSALRNLTDKDTFAFSPRKISVSTVGIVPGIQRLTREFPNVNLAFSLHSPFDEQRTQLMPVNKAYPLKIVFNALDQHITNTKNKVFVSYLMLKGVNDSANHAKALAELIRSRGNNWYLYHVNLIKYNPGPSLVAYNKPFSTTVQTFQEILDSRHIQNTVRQDFGVEIDAGCGQLYAKYSSR